MNYIRKIKRSRFKQEDLYLVDVLLDLYCVDNEDSFSYFYKNAIHFKYYKNTKLLLVSKKINYLHDVRLYRSDIRRLFNEIISEVGNCMFYDLK